MDDNLNTKTKLLNKVKELEGNQRQVELGYESDPLYAQYKSQLDTLNEQREKLRIEMSNLRSQHSVEVRDEVRFIKEEIRYMKNLADKSDGLDPRCFGEDIQESFRKCGSGTTTMHHMFRIVWVSQDQQYAIFKMRGHGGGGPYDSWYLNAQYTLYHIPSIVKDGFYNIKRNGGGILVWKSKRWSKARLKEVLEAIKNHDHE
jgi:hypothetical protein